jgi:hypothetical protein
VLCNAGDVMVLFRAAKQDVDRHVGSIQEQVQAMRAVMVLGTNVNPILIKMLWYKFD